MRSQSSRPVSVSLLALPESTPTTLYGLYEVFSAVGVTWSMLTGEPGGRRQMQPRIVAPSRDPFRCSLQVPIAPHVCFAESMRTDVVIVGDLSFALDECPRGRWSHACRWIVEQFASGAMVCSVCTGAVLLAESGLLDGYEATTHWSACRYLSAYYPAIKLKPERVLVPAGPEHRIVTSGGAASWEDLALYLIARFCGEAEAVRTAKIFVFGDRSEGQSLYAAMSQPRRHDDAIIAEAQVWVAEHYADARPVARMASRCGLATRTFTRRFKAATGYTPVEYVHALRIEEAKQLLEATAEPTDTVAERVGYQDPAFFRRLFKRRTGVTPARYRQRIRTAIHREPTRAGGVRQ